MSGCVILDSGIVARKNGKRLPCEVLQAENAKLRELVQDYHTFLALAELAQPIGYIVAAHGHPTLSIAALDERYRELGVEVDG